jgi:hypothetical protein
MQVSRLHPVAASTTNDVQRSQVSLEFLQKRVIATAERIHKQHKIVY